MIPIIILVKIILISPWQALAVVKEPISFQTKQMAMAGVLGETLFLWIPGKAGRIHMRITWALVRKKRSVFLGSLHKAVS